MKSKIIIIKLFVVSFCINANAQSTMETVLANIAKNNKTILANTQFWEAQKLQYKTGLTPNNPTVEYDYLVGTPVGAGNQTDLTVAQSFDFPTAYIKKNQLAKQQTAQAEFHLTAQRQNILFDAKKICIQLVYRNKLQTQLRQQKQNTQKLLNDFQTRLGIGEGNILDVNKAQLQLIEIKKQHQENTTAIAQFIQQLTALNGGNQITFTDAIYPVVQNIPAFDQLETEYENADPLRKILEQEILITQKEVEVSKAMWLPKMEAGYHYQGILGQTYNGIHTGISIPLWQNKNTVKLQKSKLLFADLELQDHSNQHYYEIKQLYETYTNLNITLTEYQTIFATLNNTTLLNKALSLGQISTIEYFMEINYYNIAYNNYLQTEKEYYQAIAELYKYQL
ncbi:MAG: TolC family protein [Chitinophagales bacterium]|nr:TolC family protein [Chitinophagales bacterium]